MTNGLFIPPDRGKTGIIGVALMTQTRKAVRWSVNVSKEMDDIVDALADSDHVSKADVLRRAVTLYKEANSARKQGKHVGIVSDDNKLDKEFIF